MSFAPEPVNKVTRHSANPTLPEHPESSGRAGLDKPG